MKWGSPLRVLCDSKIYTKLKRKFYKTSIRHALFNDTRCWTIKKQHIYEMNVIKVKNIMMEKWKKRKKKEKEKKEKISNEQNHLKIRVYC